MKLITIDRLWSDYGTDGDNAPGWICWVRLWKDGNDPDSGFPDDEMITNRKKDAIAWAKRVHPDARISYTSDERRTAPARLIDLIMLDYKRGDLQREIDTYSATEIKRACTFISRKGWVLDVIYGDGGGSELTEEGERYVASLSWREKS